MRARAEKDRDWELPFGNPGDLAVLMDLRDELKALNQQVTELVKMFAAQRIQQMEEVMMKAQAEGLIEDAKSAYPPPAPTPPPHAKRAVRGVRANPKHR